MEGLDGLLRFLGGGNSLMGWLCRSFALVGFTVFGLPILGCLRLHSAASCCMQTQLCSSRLLFAAVQQPPLFSRNKYTMSMLGRLLETLKPNSCCAPSERLCCTAVAQLIDSAESSKYIPAEHGEM